MALRVFLSLIAVTAWPAEAVVDPLDRAYTALREGKPEQAAALFSMGLERRPDHVNARKDYAYTALSLGETVLARDQFHEVYRRNPEDYTAGLEYAFLCFETRQRGEARRVFDRIRQSATADDAARRTAADGYQSVESALKAGIAQWTEAAAKNPDSDSVHEELARLLEDHGDLEPAEAHFRKALKLKPSKRAFLLDLARVNRTLSRDTLADAALLAVIASVDTRVAEQAREALQDRTPTREAKMLAESYSPQKELQQRRKVEISAIDMAERSYQLGYLQDALRYYREVNESTPNDPQVKLRLGWVHNQLGNDREAYAWFGRAKRATDPAVAAEAGRAWRNLRPQQALFRPTFWALPMFSSRWHSGFVYGQSKIELNAGKLPIRPYLSMRFAGDAGARNAPAPLSERAITPAIGLASRLWRGITGWAEAGGNIGNTGGLDARGGLIHERGCGHQLGAETPGAFYLASSDANYASRFQNDVMFATRHRAGYTWGPLQAGWMFAAGTDTQRRYWANFVETGPTVRVRLPWVHPAIALTVDLVRGRNFVMEGNPRKPGYYDVRVGLWYAITY